MKPVLQTLVTRHSSLVTLLVLLASAAADASNTSFYRVSRDASGAWLMRFDSATGVSSELDFSAARNPAFIIPSADRTRA